MAECKRSRKKIEDSGTETESSGDESKDSVKRDSNHTKDKMKNFEGWFRSSQGRPKNSGEHSRTLEQELENSEEDVESDNPEGNFRKIKESRNGRNKFDDSEGEEDGIEDFEEDTESNSFDEKEESGDDDELENSAVDFKNSEIFGEHSRNFEQEDTHVKNSEGKFQRGKVSENRGDDSEEEESDHSEDSEEEEESDHYEDEVEDEDAKSNYCEEESENSEKDSVQPLSIQCLNMDKVEKHTGMSSKASENLYDDGKAIIEKIIDVYNYSKKKADEKRRKKLGIENLELDEDKAYKPGKMWDQNDYFVRSYNYKYQVTSLLAKNLSTEPHSNKSDCYIIFFYRKDKNGNICIMVATSYIAWKVLRPYADSTLPFKVAEKVANPNKIMQLARHHLLGDGTKETLTNPSKVEFYKSSNLFYLIDFLVCQIKAGSSLSILLNQNLFSIRFTSAGLLRMLKRMPLKKYPSILRLFSKYMDGEITRDTNDREELKDGAFEFLHYLQLSRVPKEDLDKSAAEAIFDQRGRKLTFQLRHKYLEDFLSSSKFEIKFDSGRFQRFKQTPPELEDIIAKVNTKDKEAFTKKILKGKLRFTDISKKPHKERIIDFIEGELRCPNGDLGGETYFKVKKGWYQIKTESLYLLHDDFRTVLKKTLMRKKEIGQLPLSWRGNDEDKARITVDTLIKRLGFTKEKASKILSKLKVLNVCYVSSDNSVKQKVLYGEILKTEVIRKYKSAIEQILKNPGSLLQDEIKKVCNEDTEKVWEELKKERCVLSKIWKGSLLKMFVLNPFPYKLKEDVPNYEDLRKLLNELYELNFTEKEEVYNRSYIKKKYIDQGYLVFDQILSLNIEPCDILRCTDSSIYLYHVKEKFGQWTREVCSQIINSATLIRSALSTQQNENYLERLWSICHEKDTTKNSQWFKEVQNKLRSLGKENFIDIFRSTRNIVFVYAYLPDPGKPFSEESEKSTRITRDLLGGGNRGIQKFKMLERMGLVDFAGRFTNEYFSLTKETFKEKVKRYRMKCSDEETGQIYKKLKENEPFSDSTIAKMEIVRVAKNLESLGFDFKICEIKMKVKKFGKVPLIQNQDRPECQTIWQESANLKSSSNKKQKLMSDYFFKQ